MLSFIFKLCDADGHEQIMAVTGEKEMHVLHLPARVHTQYSAENLDQYCGKRQKHFRVSCLSSKEY